MEFAAYLEQYIGPKCPSNILKSIQDYLCCNVPASARLIIAGDFNLPGIQWHSLESGSFDVTNCDTLLDIAFNQNLTQVVKEITRSGPTRETLLDLVFVNEKYMNMR